MNIFVVGCGSIGERHIKNLTTISPHSRIIATDTSDERLSLMRERYGIETCKTLAEGFIEQVDAVVICTPPNSHVLIALAAIHNNAHVFIEKPLSNSLSGVDQLLEMAYTSSRVVFVGYCFRFNAGLLAAKKLIDSGQLGRVLFANAEFGQYLPDWRPWQDYVRSYTAKKELGGGILLDGSHEIDYLRWLIGEVKRVSCFADKLSTLEVETDDTACLLLEFANSCLGMIHLDFVRRDYSRSCEIVCEKGTIKWNYQENTLKIFRQDTRRWETNVYLPSEADDMYIAEMSHFLACINKTEKPLIDVAEGLRTLKVVLAAVASSNKREVVQLRRVVALVQARMGSTRLPGKVMKNVMGKPVLWHVIDRLRKTKLLDEIVVVTTTKRRDRTITALAKEIGVRSFTGSEQDVLDRYYQAAKLYGAEVVVRITADCPLIDPELTDEVIKYFLTNNYDYVSSARALTIRAGLYSKPAYPDGLDVEVFSFSALKKAWEEAKLLSDREHVTTYIWRNDDLFRTYTVECEEDLSNMRWTLDTKEDLRFIREIYKRLYKKNSFFGMKEILSLLKANPELFKINYYAARNEGYLKSLEKD